MEQAEQRHLSLLSLLACAEMCKWQRLPTEMGLVQYGTAGKVGGGNGRGSDEVS